MNTTKLAKLRERMKSSPQNVRFTDLAAICDHYFGSPRQDGTSHRVYRTPWPGNPRVNIQNKKGRAKPYQVRQVLEAIARMGEKEGGSK